MRSIFQNWKNDPEYARGLLQETVILNVTEDLVLEMRQLGVDRVTLASRLGKSKAFVSQLLSGSRNMTLRTLADICWALKLNPIVSFRHAEAPLISEHTSSMTLQPTANAGRARYTLIQGGRNDYPVAS